MSTARVDKVEGDIVETANLSWDMVFNGPQYGGPWPQLLHIHNLLSITKKNIKKQQKKNTIR